MELCPTPTPLPRIGSLLQAAQIALEACAARERESFAAASEQQAEHRERPLPGLLYQSQARLVALLPAGAIIQAPHLSTPLRPQAASSANGHAPPTGTLGERVAELERAAIRAALTQAGGNISRAAPELGLSRKGLQLKLKRYHIKVPWLDGPAV